MSHAFVPVQWNGQKTAYDLILLIAVAIYLGTFITIGMMQQAADPVVLMIRALGSCAIVLLHIILAIGPLARLSDRFKPLLYNRRHFGVMTALIALVHAALALMWYHGSGPINPISSAIGGYGNYGVPIEFPFESLGLVALFILGMMAATSHDFWLARLSPPVWKALHMGVYAAYAFLVGHVALGTAQFDKSGGILIALTCGTIGLIGLHLSAIVKARGRDLATALSDDWMSAGRPRDIPLNRAVTLIPKLGERIALFRYEKGLSAIVGVCTHQNGPLGEGCIIGGLVTCPWHGFQFDPETGTAPPPFEDRVQTHEVKVEDGTIWVRSTPDPLGTTRPAIPVTL